MSVGRGSCMDIKIPCGKGDKLNPKGQKMIDILTNLWIRQFPAYKNLWICHDFSDKNLWIREIFVLLHRTLVETIKILR